RMMAFMILPGAIGSQVRRSRFSFGGAPRKTPFRGKIYQMWRKENPGMSSSELDRLMMDLQKDRDLLRELKSLGTDLEASVRWANAKGYAITREEAERWNGGEGELG